MIRYNVLQLGVAEPMDIDRYLRRAKLSELPIFVNKALCMKENGCREEISYCQIFIRPYFKSILGLVSPFF